MKKFLRFNRKKGFSFIEITISLALIILLSSLILFSFNSLNNKQSFDSQIDFIKSAINKTRNDALNSKNGLNQSVIFGTTSISYDNIIVNLENNISLSSYTSATNTVTFYRLSGLPYNPMTLIYEMKKGDNIIATTSIIINNLGIIE